MTDELAPIPSFEPLPKTTPAAVTGPVGIGGWLILPMLGLIATPIVQLINLMGLTETLSHLDQLGPLLSNLVTLEAILNFGLFVVVPGILLVQFFGRTQKFPRWYIAWTAVSAVFVVADLFIGYAAFHQAYEASGTPFFNRETMRALVGALAGVCIWIPYMMNSVRVRNTFTA